MQMVSCVNKKFLFCISLLVCCLQKGICRLIITSLQPCCFHHSINTTCINREKASHGARLLNSFRPREGGYMHIYHSEGTFLREEKITHSHKNSHISCSTAALFQRDGWLKPNKVMFRDEPQPLGLFIRYIKLDPTGLSSSCLNMHVDLMKSTVLLMCFKCSLFAVSVPIRRLSSIALNYRGI